MDYIEYFDIVGLDDKDNELRQPKIYRSRYQLLLTLDDGKLVEDFRFPTAVIKELVNELSPILEHETSRSMALSMETQVLVSLKFLATGDHFNTIKDVFGIHESTVCQAVNRVINALYSIRKKYILFPSTIQEYVRNARDFAEIAGFPNVIGCVDGTHVPICNQPKADEAMYVCRKGGHSINRQIICDAKLRIIDVVANFPGTTHDSYIWRQCKINDKFEAGEVPDGFLQLGDSGYPLRPYLMMPILQPATPAETKYTRSHCKTRCTVERCIGVLKSRWRCLHISSKLRFRSPVKCCKLMYACCVLHNIARKHNLPLSDLVEDDTSDASEYTGNIADGKRHGIIAAVFYSILAVDSNELAVKNSDVNSAVKK